MNELHVARPGMSSVEHIVPLRLVHKVPLDPDRVPEVLASADQGWLGTSVPDPEPGVRRFLCDLELRAGGSGRVLFRKAAIVAFWGPRREGPDWVVPIEWRAATLTALFPVFAGRLRIAPDRIELDGSYSPPGGTIGYVLDAALLGIAARQTGRWFLRTLAKALS